MAQSLMYYINDNFATRSMNDAKDMTMGNTSTFGVYGCNWGSDSDTFPYIYDHYQTDFTGHQEKYASNGTGSKWSGFTPYGVSSNNGSTFTYDSGFNVKEAFGTIEVGSCGKHNEKTTFPSSLIGPAIQSVVGCSIVWTPQSLNYGSFARLEKIGLVYAEWTGTEFKRHILPANTLKSGSAFSDPSPNSQGAYDECYSVFQWSTSNPYYKKVRDNTFYWMGAVLTFKNKPNGMQTSERTSCKIRNFRPVIAGRAPVGQVDGKPMLFNRPTSGGASLSEIVKGKYCIC